MTTANSFQLKIRLSGRPERIMQLLTDASLIRKWSGEDGEIEPSIGGKVEFFGGWATGVVTAISHTALSFSWRLAEWPETIADTQVSIALKGETEGTTVILEHRNFDNEKELKSHQTGWQEYFFDPMEDFMLIIDKS